MKLGDSCRILKKYSNIKFHENPSSKNPIIPCKQADGERHDKAK
jgi:hypothetical protein